MTWVKRYVGRLRGSVNGKSLIHNNMISRKIVSSEQEQRLSRWANFAKNCLPRIECKELPRLREKYRALGRHVCKIRKIGGQKMGSNMQPRYIKFRDIHNRDISGLHCSNKNMVVRNRHFVFTVYFNSGRVIYPMSCTYADMWNRPIVSLKMWREKYCSW